MQFKQIKTPKLPPLEWNGPYEEQVFVAKEIGKKIVGYFVPYRYLYAYTTDKEWRGKLPFIPVGVSGLIRKGNQILFGKRGQNVTQYKGYWETPPSGSITEGPEQLDPILHILKELQEETGITKALKVTPIREVLDRETGRLDLCFQIDVDQDPILTDEYQEFIWVKVGDSLNHLGENVVPLSRQLFHL